MFIADFPDVKFVEPWTSSYDERLTSLVQGRRRIAYFYERPDTSTFRYRVLNPVLALNADDNYDVSAAWFDLDDLDRDMRFLEMADALVLCRTRYNKKIAQLIATARRYAVPVFFDCDDLVFDPDRLHLVLDSLNENQDDEEAWERWFAYVGRLGATLRLCDGIVTTNRYLADRALEFMPNLKVSVVPNYLNPAQQHYSSQLVEAKQRSQWRRDDKIHIGYFSGSPTHVRDFAIPLPAILRLMERDPRIVLRVVGFGAFGNEFDRFGDRVERIPLLDFMSLQRVIAEVEINIAPLQENQFTNCKSELKYFEAAICGSLTLASPTFTFSNSIENGVTGFIVPSYDWDSALRNAINIIEDMSKYAVIARAAMSAVEHRYGWDKQASIIVDAILS